MICERTVKKFCREDISKIENYEQAMNDKTQTWVCHHRTEIWWNCSQKDLIENECYYNRKACELIFLTRSEHKSLHNANMRDETRKKLAEALKVRTPPNKGKHHSAVTKKKMSESHKGHAGYWTGKTMSEEHRQKISESQKGKKRGPYKKKQK